MVSDSYTPTGSCQTWVDAGCLVGDSLCNYSAASEVTVEIAEVTTTCCYRCDNPAMIRDDLKIAICVVRTLVHLTFFVAFTSLFIF